MKIAAIALALAASCAVGFLGGRFYERRYWEIAPPALRAVWGAKEGPLAERLRHANRAIELDDTYLLAYVWKARAWFESGADEAPEHTIAILKHGFDEAEVDHGLYLLYHASLRHGDADSARLYHEVLLRLGGDWARDD